MCLPLHLFYFDVIAMKQLELLNVHGNIYVGDRESAEIL